MTESAKEIFYLLSFSVGTGFLLSKTIFSLLEIWQDDSWPTKKKRHAVLP